MWQGRLTSLDLPYINARALKQVRILERPNRSSFGRGLAAGPAHSSGTVYNIFLRTQNSAGKGVGFCYVLRPSNPTLNAPQPHTQPLPMQLCGGFRVVLVQKSPEQTLPPLPKSRPVVDHLSRTQLDTRCSVCLRQKDRGYFLLNRCGTLVLSWRRASRSEHAQMRPMRRIREYNFPN